MGARGPDRLLDGDRTLVANKRGPTRLGFALMLKFFELEARFPRRAGEIPPAAVDYVASQVDVGPEALADYRFSGRTFEYHRAQVRGALGFREATVSDEGAPPRSWSRPGAPGRHGPARRT